VRIGDLRAEVSAGPEEDDSSASESDDDVRIDEAASSSSLYEPVLKLRIHEFLNDSILSGSFKLTFEHIFLISLCLFLYCNC